jgi:hypothetical protein
MVRAATAKHREKISVVLDDGDLAVVQRTADRERGSVAGIIRRWVAERAQALEQQEGRAA